MKVELELDLTSDDVPEVAYQRYVADVLERLAQHAREGRALAAPTNGATPAPAPTATAAAVQTSPAAQKREVVTQEAEGWRVPQGMHLKTVKSVHRFLVAAAQLAERGPAPQLGEIAEKAKLSGPPVAKIVNAETDAGRYIRPLIRVEKKGRSKVVDVTPLGRQVASRIRAGKLPA